MENTHGVEPVAGPGGGGGEPSIQEKKPRLNKYAFCCALVASTNSILLGYDIGVMSGAILYIKDHMKISRVEEEVLVGSLNVCSLIGSFAAGSTSDAIGRRYTIVLSSATFLIGALLMGLAPSYPFLMAGRLIAGIGVGYSLMIAPLYSAEISPASSRGLLASLSEVFIVLGILLGYIFNYVLSGLPEHMNWRIMLGIAAIPAFFIGICVIFMPESPRWLVMKGRQDEAKKALGKVSSSPEEAQLRHDEILKDLEDASSRPKGMRVWKEILWKPTPQVRRILVCALGINFFMQASGNDAVIYYTPEVFKSAGIHHKKQLVGITVIMGLTKTAFVLVSALFLDHYGRRLLLLIGTGGMIVALGGLGLGSKFLENHEAGHKPQWAIVICVMCVCTFVSFFSIGLGPITWVYTSEIFPTRLRAQGNSLAISVNRLVSGTVAMTFLSISHAISFGGMFFILCGIMVVAFAFFYFVLPETKGKTLEEIGALFEKEKDGDKNRQ
ncbi:probable polyol transporter 6 [Cornus florida]|uniref:probable polyol transporter 6 n=1 Tax=Cornus florida TaxID=4283 RepID=UPI00289C3D6A|nr:probable polyol transporter 6 [Cornus florida]